MTTIIIKSKQPNIQWNMGRPNSLFMDKTVCCAPSSGGLSKTYSLLNLFNFIIVYHKNIKWPTTNLIVDLINQKLI